MFLDALSQLLMVQTRGMVDNCQVNSLEQLPGVRPIAAKRARIGCVAAADRSPNRRHRPGRGMSWKVGGDGWWSVHDGLSDGLLVGIWNMFLLFPIFRDGWLMVSVVPPTGYSNVGMHRWFGFRQSPVLLKQRTCWRGPLGPKLSDYLLNRSRTVHHPPFCFLEQFDALYYPTYCYLMLSKWLIVIVDFRFCLSKREELQLGQQVGGRAAGKRPDVAVLLGHRGELSRGSPTLLGSWARNWGEQWGAPNDSAGLYQLHDVFHRGSFSWFLFDFFRPVSVYREGFLICGIGLGEK